MAIQIRKVEKDAELMQRLLNFVENFFWNEVREHTLRQISNWEYEDWESPFIAMDGEKIIGIATLMKTDITLCPKFTRGFQRFLLRKNTEDQRKTDRFCQCLCKRTGI